MFQGFARLIAVSALFFLCACYPIRIERPVSGQDPVQMHQNFFLFGLIGEPTIDLRKECSGGVASFGDRATPLDWVFSILTIGLYTPRTVTIECQQ
jgi:hypothetical protein